MRNGKGHNNNNNNNNNNNEVETEAGRVGRGGRERRRETLPKVFLLQKQKMILLVVQTSPSLKQESRLRAVRTRNQLLRKHSERQETAARILAGVRVRTGAEDEEIAGGEVAALGRMRVLSRNRGRGTSGGEA